MRNHALGFAVVSPSDVELEPEFLSQPDVFVIPKQEWRRLRRKEDHVIREVSLAVEVLSSGSGRHDRVRKRPMYQRHVTEYWSGDADARLFERWRPGDARPEILTETLEWRPEGASEPFRLDLNHFFARLLDDSD